MIDYSKYEVVKTEKIVTSSAETSRSKMFDIQRDEVNDSLKWLLSVGYESIEITHNDVASETRVIYMSFIQLLILLMVNLKNLKSTGVSNAI